MTNDVLYADHIRMANAIRALSMDAVERARSGHPGMPMGMADVATVLFDRFLRFDPKAPGWPDRDRFVLSAGHGSMLLYALLHLTGYDDMPIGELEKFRQLGSRTAGHPEYGLASGIETTTGPLGQGIATAVGMALAERLLNARFGDGLVDHHTYIIASDGDLMEGISHEACSLAGHLRLAKLIVLFDDNSITIDGPADLSVSDDQIGRFAAYGWHTQRVDGHDHEAVATAIEAARSSNRPSLIACRTIIGKGAPTKAGTSASHGAPLGEDEIKGAREALDWPDAPFEIPGDVRACWQRAGGRGAAPREAWEHRLAGMPIDVRSAWQRGEDGKPGTGIDAAFNAYKRRLAEERPGWASRKASQEALEVLTREIPEMIGGSADLTGSNNTNTKVTAPINAADFSGRYVYYGVREHGMMAAMNGMALHGGIIPYGGTFLIFSDYCRPAIRLAALMRQRVILVATHDSIGLGEDGPTHQPVEHLAALRAIPGVHVHRPADAIETAECWRAALERRDGPAVITLTRQGLPALRTSHTDDNLAARGAYVLIEASGPRQATILATGSEVALAVEARGTLEAEGIATAVVSMPCQELFDGQPASYRAETLGTAPRVAIEAATPMGWTRYLASEDDFVGMTGFGASAPARDLYDHFGITSQAVVKRVRRLI